MPLTLFAAESEFISLHVKMCPEQNEDFDHIIINLTVFIGSINVAES